MIKFINKFQNKLYFSNADFRSDRISICLILLLLISIFINLAPRVYEKNIWEEYRSVFYAEDEPLVRGGDPAYFISLAKYYKDGNDFLDYFNKLIFPSKISGEPGIPPLSYLISLFAKDSSTKEIVRSANNLIFYSSILTTIGVFFLFYAIGRPFEGIIASTGAGISSAYLSRSSYGYIDTDMLNLFFIYSLFALIYLASRRQSWFKTVCFIISASTIGKLFYIWYPKPELIVISFLSLVFFTTFNSKNWKKVLFNSLIFIIFTDISIYINSLNIFINNPYLAGYLSANVQSIDLVNNTSLNFNNIFRYIGEQQKPPIIDLFKLEGSIFLGFLCFLGIVLWAITYPLIFIGCMPLLFFSIIFNFR